MVRYRTVSLTGALALVFSLVMFTPVFASHTADTALPNGENPAVESPEIVPVATNFVYTVKKGDSLLRIAKRFEVPFSEIDSPEYNPLLAARKNKNLIYPGEKIELPLLRAKPRTFDSVDDADLVLLTKGRIAEIEKVYQMRIAALETENVWKTRVEFLSISGMFILAIALLVIGSMKANNATYFAESSNEDVLEALRSLTGGQLAEIMDETFVKDEAGNPVTLKKIKDFLAKDHRASLRELPASEWAHRFELEQGGSFAD